MTVDQLIRFVAAFYQTWDHALGARYVGQFQIPLDKKVKHLSKGQNVRLGLLLALAHRPEVMILDDPALALDPIMRKDFNRDVITHLQGSGCTVLYSSHLLAEVEAVADRVAILHDGRIVREATPEDLRNDVKRLIFPAKHLTSMARQLQLLDTQAQGLDVCAVVDQAASAVRILGKSGVVPRVIDLNLDEIFEAFVIGRAECDGQPRYGESVAIGSTETP